VIKGPRLVQISNLQFILSFSHSELASYLGSIFPLFSTAFTPVYGVLLDAIGRKGAMLVAGFLYGMCTVGRSV
jgi:MFS family permease